MQRLGLHEEIILKSEEEQTFSNAQKIDLNCPICSEWFDNDITLEAYNEHLSKHKCDICSKILPYVTLREEHMTEHNSEGQYKCQSCPATFRKQYNLKDHEATIHNITTKCYICLKELSSTVLLERHLQTHSKRYKCNTCFKAFKTLSNLKAHMSCHSSERPFACPICSFAFKTKETLKNHEKTHEDREFECDVCLKKFQRKESVQSHRRRHFEGVSVFCHLCSKGYYSERALRAHTLSKHEKISNNVCGICGKTVTQLKKHMARVHKEGFLENMKCKCNICEKAFISESLLKRHIKSHTGEKDYVCDICGKAFTGSQGLEKHKLAHVGVKPVECHDCGKRFSDKPNLIVHIRSHTGEKPYKCQYCPKAFTQRPPLNIHLRVHTGERPYTCDVCQQCFIAKNALDSHKRKKHKLV